MMGECQWISTNRLVVTTLVMLVLIGVGVGSDMQRPLYIVSQISVTF